MKIRSIAAICLLLGLAACKSPDLERSRVPIFWGMRFDKAAAEAELNPNLTHLRTLTMRELALELPLIGDSNGLPRIPALPYSPIKGLLLRHKVGLHITIAPSAAKELFPDGKLVAVPALWFATLEREVDTLLKTLHPCPVDRVVIGSNLTPAEAYGDEWTALLANLRKGRETLFSYGSTPESLSKLTFLKASDELAVDYPPTAGAELKSESREINLGIERIADSLHMPLYIFRANLIGEEQTAQLQNRLRFWDKKTRFRGISINTLYARIPLRDSSSYYGLMDNPEFLEFLEDYRERD